MGLFDWLFGRKPATLSREATDAVDYNRPIGSQITQGPPEYIQGVELQRAYWTYNAEEQLKLEARGLERLSWPERLRLHHLNCL